jgi:hypothetical protein
VMPRLFPVSVFQTRFAGDGWGLLVTHDRISGIMDVITTIVWFL